MLLIGVDEAGYGPLLGPLVVSTVALTLPDELAGISLWQLFAAGLTDRVADSKKVYRAPARDLRELERSSLAAVQLESGLLPADFTQLLRAVSLEPDPHLSHQWYCHQNLTLPCKIDADALRLSTSLMKRELDAVHAKISAVKSVPLVEKKYNHMVRLTKNKSEVLFSQTVRLITKVLDDSQENNVRICIDKQGGKDSYVKNLLQAFSDANLAVEKEDRQESIYCLNYPNRSIKIHFCEKGESQHLLIAWASLISKFLRELFMTQFNAFWRSHNPELRPTAGYWEDGHRFLNDIEPILSRLKIPPADLTRLL